MRQSQLEKLKEFSQTIQKKQEDQILKEKFLAYLKNNPDFEKIGITVSMSNEVDTFPIIETLIKQKKEVYIPRCLPEKQMEFTKLINLDRLTRSKFGVLEDWQQDAEKSNNLDLIVTPGLAFDMKNHNRLGFGGGFYDRFLEKHPSHTVSLANSYQIFSNSIWQIDKFDIPINDILTV